MNSSPHKPTSEPLSVVGVCLDQETWGFLELFAESAPLIQLRSQISEYPDTDSINNWSRLGIGVLGSPVPYICIIDFDRDRRKAIKAAQDIHSVAPEIALFAISSDAQPDLIIQAMRSGCSEYLLKPMGRKQLLNAVARVGGRRGERSYGRERDTMALPAGAAGLGESAAAIEPTAGASFSPHTRYLRRATDWILRRRGESHSTIIRRGSTHSQSNSVPANHGIPAEELLREYLLGRCSLDEQDGVEQSVLSESSGEHLLDLMSVVEDELIDDYVTGELSKSDLHSFESRFLFSQQRLEKIYLSALLHNRPDVVNKVMEAAAASERKFAAGAIPDPVGLEEYSVSPNLVKVEDLPSPRDAALLRAINREGRDPDEVCRAFGVSRNYVRELEDRVHRALSFVSAEQSTENRSEERSEDQSPLRPRNEGKKPQ